MTAIDLTGVIYWAYTVGSIRRRGLSFLSRDGGRIGSSPPRGSSRCSTFRSIRFIVARIRAVSIMERNTLRAPCSHGHSRAPPKTARRSDVAKYAAEPHGLRCLQRSDAVRDPPGEKLPNGIRSPGANQQRIPESLSGFWEVNTSTAKRSRTLAFFFGGRFFPRTLWDLPTPQA